MRTFIGFDSKSLGEVLKIYRKAHNLTQEKVAEYLGIERSTYSKYEKSRSPEIEVILKLSDLYQISLDTFMSEFFSDESELSTTAAASAPAAETTLILNEQEMRLLSLYRESIRKAQIMKAAEEIYNTDNDIISEIKGS